MNNLSKEEKEPDLRYFFKPCYWKPRIELMKKVLAEIEPKTFKVRVSANPKGISFDSDFNGKILTVIGEEDDCYRISNSGYRQWVSKSDCELVTDKSRDEKIKELIAEFPETETALKEFLPKEIDYSKAEINPNDSMFYYNRANSLSIHKHKECLHLHTYSRKIKFEPSQYDPNLIIITVE